MGSKFRLSLTLDRETKSRVRKEAKRRGISSAELIREGLYIYLNQGGLESRDEIDRLREEVNQFRKQLYPIGSNLNQLLITWNDVRVVDSERLKTVIELTHDIQQEAVTHLKEWKNALNSIR